MPRSCLILPVLLAFSVPAFAERENAQVLRPAFLMDQPFIDAAKVGPVTANQPVVIVERRGGWAQVEGGGVRGWVRILNLRLQAGARPIARPAALTALRTGSSGRTATTGIKGMDEETIRAASPNTAALATLASFAANADDARAQSLGASLKENQVGYLDKGKKRK